MFRLFSKVIPFALLWASTGPLAALADAPCGGPGQADRLAGLTPLGDFVLASGRLARLAGIRLPDGLPRAKALAWLKERENRAVRVAGEDKADRWNRVTLNIADDSSGQSYAEALLDAGLAVVDISAGVSAACGKHLLTREAQARIRGLGVWAEEGYTRLKASQTDRLRERLGAFVLVEGRVRSIGERQQRTYLNFGGKWAEDFTIIIPKAAWKAMAEQGLTAGTLKGRHVRARGILEDWQGTALTVKEAGMIETVDETSP